MSRFPIACAPPAPNLASPPAAQSSFVRESTLGFLAHGRSALRPAQLLPPPPPLTRPPCRLPIPHISQPAVLACTSPACLVASFFPFPE
jgi:hypothetical protein